MKIVNIWKFLRFMSMANAPTPEQRLMANALPLGHRKLANPSPYPEEGPSEIHLILPLPPDVEGPAGFLSLFLSSS